MCGDAGSPPAAGEAWGVPFSLPQSAASLPATSSFKEAFVNFHLIKIITNKPGSSAEQPAFLPGSEAPALAQRWFYHGCWKEGRDGQGAEPLTEDNVHVLRPQHLHHMSMLMERWMEQAGRGTGPTDVQKAHCLHPHCLSISP